MGVSQNWGTLLEVPITRFIVFGVYIGVILFWETTILLLLTGSVAGQELGQLVQAEAICYPLSMLTSFCEENRGKS